MSSVETSVREVATAPPDVSDVSAAMGDAPSLRLGELARRSEVVIEGTILAIDEPVWNSADNVDWTDRSEKNEFTAPLQFTRATIQVDDVLWRQDSAIPVESGTNIDVWYLGDPSAVSLSERTGEDQRLVSGDQRLVFLERSPLPFETGYGAPVWRSEMRSGTWSIVAGVARPNMELLAAELTLSGLPDGIPLDEVGNTITRALSAPSEVPTDEIIATIEGEREPDLPDAADARVQQVELEVLLPLELEFKFTRVEIEVPLDATKAPTLSVWIDSIDMAEFNQVVATLDSSYSVDVIVNVEDGATLEVAVPGR
jgi:hypothetical protein